MKNEETEKEFLSKYDLRNYPSQALTADLAIFTIREEELSILLIQRGGHPDKGKWALPGGFVNVEETVDEAAMRELKEETGISIDEVYLEQLKTYASPDRDPRGFIASCSYVALVPMVSEPTAGDDAAKAEFFPVSKVLNGMDLAFDHKIIIKDALERVRAKIEYSPIAPKFLKNDEFTISELRRVYEIVWDRLLNTSNFRRKVLSIENFAIPTGGKRKSLTEGGRESDLYKLGTIDTIYPPLRQL